MVRGRWHTATPHQEGAMKILTAFAFACLVFAPVAATAGAQEDQQACMNDAMSICGAFIPDRGKVGMCLYQNRSSLSPACRSAMTRFSAPTASRAKGTVTR